MNSLFSISFFILLLQFTIPGQSFPNGAPNVPKVCKDLFPYHSGAPSQTSTSPFYLVSNINNIFPGSSVNVTLVARPGASFKGFIVQARCTVPAENTKPFGNFEILDPKDSKTLKCGGLNGSSVTHSNSDKKNSTSFMWSAPEKCKGHVMFHATVVQDFRTFWNNISMKMNVVTGSGKTNLYPKHDQLKDLSSKDDYVDSAVFQFNRTIYGECGETKACFGIPNDCVTTKSCDALVTVTAHESKHEFEMVGIQYVASSISENGNLNTGSVTECMLVDDAVVRLYQPRYESSSGYLHEIPSSDLEVINSSYFDGMVYCKFARREEITLDGVRYTFKNNKFFILLGTEQVEPEKTAKDINVDNVKFHVSERNNYLSNVSGFSLPRNPTHSPQWYHKVKRVILEFIFGAFYFLPNLVREYLNL